MRKELIILENKKNIEKIKKEINNCGSIYLKVDKYTISETRKELINLNFTTRLIVLNSNKVNYFFIYGKRKGGKGVFKEHCKNTVFFFPDIKGFYEKIIEVNSNENDTILTDFPIETNRKTEVI